MDRKEFELTCMGVKWNIVLRDSEHMFEKGELFTIYGNTLSFNTRAIMGNDHMIATMFDGLFDSVINRFCSEDNWNTKMLANLVGQVFTDHKSRGVINEIIKHYSRYTIHGDEHYKYNCDDELQSYMFDAIEIKFPHYWEMEIWIEPDTDNETENGYKLSRSGFSESYTLVLDPKKIGSVEKVLDCLDECIERAATGTFEGMEDVKSSYTLKQLKRKLSETDYDEIRIRLTEEFDTLLDSE